MHKQRREAEKTRPNRLPHIPLPFKEVIADVLKVKPPEKHLEKK